MIELNKVYCMDNLELLKQLPDNYIDLIYCDILYGTGRNFGDYQDLKCDREVIEDHYLPRIKEMYRVLKDTGSIYLQMDTRINHWMRCLMDDVFGYDNFRREIIWDIEVLSGYKTLSKNWILGHQNILYYSKSDKYIFNKLKQSHTEKYLSSFNKIDKDGRSFQVAHGRKIYKDVVIDKGKPFGDVWKDIKSFQQQPTAMERKLYKYDTQKPKALIERIIKASSNEGDIIADFYMGSGTSMVVAKELNRQFIGCDISQKAVDITNQRIAQQDVVPKV
jgi:adenine-specific DNA-methyltransferase